MSAPDKTSDLMVWGSYEETPHETYKKFLNNIKTVKGKVSTDKKSSGKASTDKKSSGKAPKTKTGGSKTPKHKNNRGSDKKPKIANENLGITAFITTIDE